MGTTWSVIKGHDGALFVVDKKGARIARVTGSTAVGEMRAAFKARAALLAAAPRLAEAIVAGVAPPVVDEARRLLADVEATRGLLPKART